VAELNGTAHSAEMAEGLKSQFDVLINDELAFSKQRDGRFPELADILGKLA
jgi:predicted Rdx family selenoprotein